MENFLSNLLGSFGIFPSKEKLEKREAYQNEMFPFGDEEKRLVTQHLQRVNRTYRAPFPRKSTANWLRNLSVCRT